MGDCRTCPKEKRVVQRPYKSVPRQTKFSSRTTNNTYYAKPYQKSGGDCCPQEDRDSCRVTLHKPVRCSPCADPCFERTKCCNLCADPCCERPGRCSPCADPCFERPRRCGLCTDPCCERPGRCSPCADTCFERPRRCNPCLDSCYDCTGPCSPCIDPCNYCPENTESGFLCAIRNGFQRIFTGRKRNCSPLYKGKIYNYSSTQLKFMERQLDKLENEAYCLESAIKEAFNCRLQVSCTNLRCSLSALIEKVECLRSDLTCAYECYNPCRDKCEFELICCLMDRVNCLDTLLNDLCLQLECLEYQDSCCRPCGPRQCKPGCCKPCCKPQCQPMCEKGCCSPRTKGCSSCKPNLCRKSSVIPLGVMLVKL